MLPTYRHVQPTDIATAMELITAFYAEEGYELDRTKMQHAVEQLLNNAHYGRMWFICEADQPVGYTVLTLGFSLQYHGRDAFIDELYVQPAARGRGYGRQTMLFLEQACRELGAHAVHLEVEHVNTKAQALYRSLNYFDGDRYLWNKWID
jgi:ribosomal protein S18 acetylase RimI-like enzyme